MPLIIQLLGMECGCDVDDIPRYPAALVFYLVILIVAAKLNSNVIQLDATQSRS